MTSQRIVTICSGIPKLSSHIERVMGSSTMIVNIDPPRVLDETICKQTDFLIADAGYIEPLLSLPNYGRLKFVLSTWAGIDYLVRKIKDEKLEPTLKLARFNHGKFSQLMAEYSVAAVINMERDVRTMINNQNNKEWNKSGLSGYRRLSELKIGILGMGQMGIGVAKAFSAFGCEISGLVSSPREPSDMVSKYFTVDNMTEILSSVDYLINVLPATPQTDNILSRERVSVCDNVGFVNIGRGNVISEEDIIFAVDNNKFRAAYLDVFNEEPLSQSSALWSHPSITITPHVAGESRAQDIAECFKNNMTRFDSGEEIHCLVDWRKLY